MFEEILISALSEFDDNTLNYILESCNEDELNYIDMAIEAVSDADSKRLSSGYKLDNHNGIKGFIKSFRDSGADKWKNLAHDIGTHATRIKYNLRGEGDDAASRFATGDLEKLRDARARTQQRVTNALKNSANRREEARKTYGDNSSEYKTADDKYKKVVAYANKKAQLQTSHDHLYRSGLRVIKKNMDFRSNRGSLSYKIGNGLKAIRDYTKDKINAWKANRQQNKNQNSDDEIIIYDESGKPI